MPGRRLTGDDNGLSAVLGTILVIGIAVALTVAALLMFNKIREDANIDDKPAVVGMATDSDTQSISVVGIRTEDDLDWFRDVSIGGSCEPLLNGAAYPSALGTPVVPGDRLECDPGEDIRIVVDTGEKEVVVYSNTFNA